jgi:hypothetical protein
MSAISTSISSGMLVGASTKVVSARGQRTYSACPPSTEFAGAELPNSSPGEVISLWLMWWRCWHVTFGAARRLPADAVEALAACSVEWHNDLSAIVSSSIQRKLLLLDITFRHVSFIHRSADRASQLLKSHTLSPILNLLTLSPFSTISPTNSWPQMKSGGHLRCPR